MNQGLIKKENTVPTTRRRRKKKTKYTAEYEELYNGIQRCLKCGFAMAPKEEKMHSSYHSSYEKCAKQVLKDTGVETISTYQEYQEKHELKKELIATIQKGTTKTLNMVSVYETLLEVMLNLEYNSTIRFYDFNKEHPNFEDYKILLLNTPEFVGRLLEVLPLEFIEGKVKSVLSNRKLKYAVALSTDYLICTGVEITAIAETIDIGALTLIDLSHLDSLNTEEVVEVEEEVDDEEEVVGEGEVSGLENSLSWLGKLINA